MIKSRPGGWRELNPFDSAYIQGSSRRNFINRLNWFPNLARFPCGHKEL